MGKFQLVIGTIGQHHSTEQNRIVALVEKAEDVVMIKGVDYKEQEEIIVAILLKEK